MNDEPLCRWCHEPIGDHDIAVASYPDTLQGVRYVCPPLSRPKRDVSPIPKGKK